MHECTIEASYRLLRGVFGVISTQFCTSNNRESDSDLPKYCVPVHDSKWTSCSYDVVIWEAPKLRKSTSYEGTRRAYESVVGPGLRSAVHLETRSPALQIERTRAGIANGGSNSILVCLYFMCEQASRQPRADHACHRLPRAQTVWHAVVAEMANMT